MRPFRFGVMADAARNPEELVALATWAETSGFSTLLLRDHVVEHTFGHQLGPLTAMALAAMHTETLRIGTLVISNDFRPPLILAKEIATLDVISGGRIELGLGAGFLEPEYATLGIPFDAPGVRVARLEEATVLLRGLFSGEPVTFHGKHYTVDGFATYPRPVQGDHLPILVAGSGDRMLRMAARRADIVGLQAAGTSSSRMDDPTGRLAASVARKIDLIRSAAGERFPQIELNTTVVVEICEDREARAREIIEARGWTNLGAGDVLQMPSLLIGTLAEISEQLRRQRDELALSYLVVSQAQAPLLAPMVKNLSGT